MRSSKFPVVPTLLFAALVAAALIDCGGDDTSEGGPGGSAGATGGKAGNGMAGNGTAGTSAGSSVGGSAGSSGGGNGGTAGNGGTGGSAGMAGKAGAAGVGDSGPDVKADVTADTGDACNAHNVIHTLPTVPAELALPVTGATLLGGYRATGDQIYTCIAGDAGTDTVAASAGTWQNTAEAVLTGDACAKAADHFYPGPSWKAVDGSTVSAGRVTAIDPPGTDGGTATAIKWVLLKTTTNTGEGIFANVTWVQRINTTAGLQPSATCDPTKAADAGGVVRVPYTADYFFYSGGTSNEAGADASDDGSADSGG